MCNNAVDTGVAGQVDTNDEREVITWADLAAIAAGIAVEQAVRSCRLR